MTCGRAECRRQRKLEKDREWREANPGCFQGRYAEIKAWRAEHPGYQREWRARHRGEIQVEMRRETPVKSAFIGTGIRVVSRGGEIQVQIPRGMPVRMGLAACGAAVSASGG